MEELKQEANHLSDNLTLDRICLDTKEIPCCTKSKAPFNSQTNKSSENNLLEINYNRQVQEQFETETDAATFLRDNNNHNHNKKNYLKEE